MAEKTGIEPATSCVTGMRSNQLSYFSKLVDSNGFEPLRFLQNGFTVRRLQPLGQLSRKRIGYWLPHQPLIEQLLCPSLLF